MRHFFTFKNNKSEKKYLSSQTWLFFKIKISSIEEKLTLQFFEKYENYIKIVDKIWTLDFIQSILNGILDFMTNILFAILVQHLFTVVY